MWFDRKVKLVIAAACFATQATAQGLLTDRPATCVLLATAQFDDCSIDNRYFCPAKEGAHFRIESFDAEGLTFVAIEEEDYRFRELIDKDGAGMIFDKSLATHPRDVLTTGTGTQSGVGMLSVMGLKQRMSMIVTMTSIGETVSLAGKNWAVIDAQGQMTFPEPVGDVIADIRYAYLPEEDIIVELESSSSYAGGVIEESRLQAVALENQPGFGSEQPAFGCGELSLVPFTQEDPLKG
jgi:hypothetical protein